MIAAPLSRLAMTEKAASENAVSLENKLGDVSLEKWILGIYALA